MKLLSGNSNGTLSQAIADHLGESLTKAEIRRFADGEVFVEIQENVRGEDVFVIQSTSYPANDNLMELLIMIDALSRASASRVTAVLPYFGYARQDRKAGPRTPISAKLVANLITTAGADRVLTVDLHAGQIQGFFDIPTDNLYAVKQIEQHIRKTYNGESDKLCVVSPDVGGVVRARALAKRLGDTPLAIVDKRRPKAGVSEVMNIIGEVDGLHCILFDDIVDSGGTLCNAADALMDQGAASVSAYVTHGVLSGKAVERINNAKGLQRLVVTDSIEATDAVKNSSKVEQVSMDELLGEAIRRIANEESVSSLFD
jgi:ribose-phosphate pyrophosphokinase